MLGAEKPDRCVKIGADNDKTHTELQGSVAGVTY